MKKITIYADDNDRFRLEPFVHGWALSGGIHNDFADDLRFTEAELRDLWEFLDQVFGATTVTEAEMQ